MYRLCICFAVAVLFGLLAGCGGEKTTPKADKTAEFKNWTTRKASERPWTTKQAAPKTTQETAPTSTTMLEQSVKQLNEARAKMNQLPLRLNPVLTKLAQEYAEQNSKERQNRRFDENVMKSLLNRAREAGLSLTGVGHTSDAVVEAPTADNIANFLKSPLLTKGLSGANYTDIGIGFAVGSDRKTYLVIIYGVEAVKS